MTERVEGTHILAEFYGCDCDEQAILNATYLECMCLSLVEKSGLKSVGRFFHQFSPGGVTGTVVLAESHLAIHTWPEQDNFVSLDVYVCNCNADNSTKAHALYDLIQRALNPTASEMRIVKRGAVTDLY